jgi:protein SCO1/2
VTTSSDLSDMTTMSRGRSQLSRRACALLAGVVLALASCGGSDGDSAQETSDPALSGIVREPAPRVDLVSLPSLSEPGDDVEFRADDGEIQVVYFGYTNCPDVCPTTLADLTVALRLLGEERAGDVEVVMATVDPERDLDILDGYVTSFIPDAVAAGTNDDELLEAAGEPFGASWDVRTTEDGTVEVDHSPFLYAVDDQGRLVLTWQFGASPQDMADDLETLLDRTRA